MLANKIKAVIKKYGLLKMNDIVLVALSGGPDSVTLLYLLNSLKKEFNLKIISAHLNHMLRGEDSRRDLRFAQKLSKKLKIPFFSEEIDVKKINIARISGGPEEAARKIRQDFLFRIAHKVKSFKIALGHTKDDQAETMLMRILRGSGLYGLSAILPKRKISKYILIRPLIEVDKKEILTYLRKRKIPYRLDQTNKKDIYFRNRIRKYLLPELKKYNKNIAGILSNTAQSVSLDYEYIKIEAERCLNKLKNLRTKSQINIKTKKMLKVHPALRRMILRLAIQGITGNLRRLTYKHIQELEDLINNRKIGSIVDLPQNISALKTSRLIKFYKRNN